MPIRPHALRSRLLLSGALALTLAACKEDRPRAAVEPLFVPADSAAYAYDPGLAPAWSDLPAYTPAIGRPADDGYGYAERAYAVDRAFYQSPPDYAFAYDDAQPWAWETEDDWLMYVEPLAVGYRYYYYEPGDRYPYFVRDPDYAYGYDDGGVLVVIYDGRGQLLPTPYVSRYADRAGRYLVRARALRDASSQARHISVAETRWAERRPAFVGDQATWFETARRQPDWARHRAKDEAKDLRRFDRERERRADSVARLDRIEARQEWRVDDGERLERRAGRAERPQIAAAPRNEARAARDDRHGDRRVETAHAERAPERLDVRRRAEVEQPRAVARPERQVRRDDRTDEPNLKREARATPQRAERPVERQAGQQAPERQAREARGPERAAVAEKPREAAPPPVRVERQARREDRGPERQASAHPPERQAKADRAERAERPSAAQDAGKAGRDAATSERGGGKDRKER
ncbi:hypothetical protein [Phenylobacterium sp.]|uniref:hypothetical protein n=1 Tax=Phenylobacterium sp. TaxID=1871053 RepID=UPI0027364F53|nr:hypothetical protein [Phenylobacterium sp.]MDP3854780.1 hypothetical protein [Phenylobacterium sp.]